MRAIVTFALALAGAGALLGGAFASSPSAPKCFGKTATITGSGLIVGTEAADVIVGSDSSDSIDGAGGDDLICSGAGDDQIQGGLGDDRIAAGDGNDRVSGDLF